MRIAFVVDRRLVVDDAHRRAEHIAARLAAAAGGADCAEALRRAALRLAGFAASGIPEEARAHFAPKPLAVVRLRGGIPREDDWAATPVQPTVVCSTVDQVGSRLLFRGYGVSDSAKPIHAGLLGADCRIFLDEAHLAAPFRETLASVARYRGPKWRDVTPEGADPWGISVLTATPGALSTKPFRLAEDDRSHPVLAARLTAAKPAVLLAPVKTKAAEEDGDDEADGAADEADQRRHVDRLAAEAMATAERLRRAGLAEPAVAVVVNRVKRARLVHERLLASVGVDAAVPAEALLLIGPARPVERDGLAESLSPIRTGAAGPDGRRLGRPLFVVATQTIEAGVDIDLDGLVTEAAPLDALRQRFGRLNRAGRAIPAEGTIVASRSDVSARGEDAVYGTAIRETWAWLQTVATPADKSGEKDKAPRVDFGIAAFEQLMEASPPPPGLLAPTAQAPVLMPAHVDLLRQTSPIPAQGPDIGLMLHGPALRPAGVTVVWRADLSQDDAAADIRQRLLLMPPRSAEAIELPVGAVRAWLAGRTAVRDPLADVPQPEIEDDGPVRRPLGAVFRWAGDDERSEWIRPTDVFPGATIVVPAVYGGVDGHGWNPTHRETAVDVADRAAAPYAGRRFALRLAPGLAEALADKAGGETLVTEDAEAVANRRRAALQDGLSNALAHYDRRDKASLFDRLMNLRWPEPTKLTLERIQETASTRAPGGWRAIEVHTELYGNDEVGRPRGVIVVATRGLTGIADTGQAALAATEDDIAGSTSGVALPLDRHLDDVARFAASFAEVAGLGEWRTQDLTIAARLHDLGKSDGRFQARLQQVDPLFLSLLGAALPLLAKSDRAAPRGPVDGSGLPKYWRHEALSVRLAPLDPAFADASDPDLVLWLIGTHHGRGRPFFHFADPADEDARTLRLPFDREITLAAGPGPQSLAFERDGSDWPRLFERLAARYGAWELARMEAILRLADHRASEWAEVRYGAGEADAISTRNPDVEVTP